MTGVLGMDVPAVVPVTGAVIVQEAPAARVNAAIVNPVPSARAVTAPPFWQVEVVFANTLGKVRPAGTATMTPPWALRDTDGLGLVMVNDRVEIPVIRIVEGLKEVATWNGADLLTVSEAVAVLLIPADKALTELVAVNVPAVVPVTGAVIVHEAPAARVNAAIVNPVPSARAVTAPPFWQVEVVFANTLGKVRPAGTATMTPPSTLRDTDGLGLVMVNDKVETPPIRMVDGLKELAITNGAGLLTVSAAVAVLLIPAYKALMELLAVNVPAVVPVTGAVIVQDAPAASFPARRSSDLPSARAVTAPPF